MNIPNFYVEPASYESDFEDLSYVRKSVFVDEQQIPPEIEFDEHDRQCHHFIARDQQRRPVGSGRLSPEGKIGRMAVLYEWRRQGVGESLLQAAIDKARHLKLTKITAHAQVSVLGFYEKYGFIREGDTFIEAGILHQVIGLMVQPLVEPVRQPLRSRAPSVHAVRLDSVESILAATVQLISDSRRQLCIYSRDLEYDLYQQSKIVEALKLFALRNRNGNVQIILQEPESLRGRSHPVLELAQKLSSHFFIRTPVEENDIQYSSAFIVNDHDGYLFRLLGDRYEGQWSPNLPARNRQLQEEFERVWQRSRPCTEFRALGL